MRISDWSSAVCSSDLDIEQESREDILARSFYPNGRSILFAEQEISDDHRRDRLHCCRSRCRAHDSGRPVILGRFRRDFGVRQYESRSEEHTSELQSLMRISYSVFCLKKKIIPKYIHTISTNYHNHTLPNIQTAHHLHLTTFATLTTL